MALAALKMSVLLLDLMQTYFSVVVSPSELAARRSITACHDQPQQPLCCQEQTRMCAGQLLLLGNMFLGEGGLSVFTDQQRIDW